MTDETTTLSYVFKAETKEAGREIKRLNDQARLLSKNLLGAFDQIIVKGRDVDQVFKSLALNVSKRAFATAIKPVEQSLTAGLVPNGAGLLGSILGFAKGGVVEAGMAGRVVNSPISFPLGSSRGIAGEAGPEAILPLSRGPNGELGVRTNGSAAPNITINISTPDIESFRRSQGEIAARMNRLVARGNRNL